MNKGKHPVRPRAVPKARSRLQPSFGISSRLSRPVAARFKEGRISHRPDSAVRVEAEPGQSKKLGVDQLLARLSRKSNARRARSRKDHSVERNLMDGYGEQDMVNDVPSPEQAANEGGWLTSDDERSPGEERLPPLDHAQVAAIVTATFPQIEGREPDPILARFKAKIEALRKREMSPAASSQSSAESTPGRGRGNDLITPSPRFPHPLGSGAPFRFEPPAAPVFHSRSRNHPLDYAMQPQLEADMPGPSGYHPPRRQGNPPTDFSFFASPQMSFSRSTTVAGMGAETPNHDKSIFDMYDTPVRPANVSPPRKRRRSTSPEAIFDFGGGADVSHHFGRPHRPDRGFARDPRSRDPDRNRDDVRDRRRRQFERDFGHPGLF